MQPVILPETKKTVDRAKPEAASGMAPKSTRLYCIGLAKTGTRSIASMFGPPLRSAHEPTANVLIRHILALHRGVITKDQFLDWLKRRNDALALDVDSSGLNVFIVGFLLALPPRRRFVLTVRHPVSWLRSIVDHCLRLPADSDWQAFRELRFGRPNVVSNDNDRLLVQRGLYPVGNFLRHWSAHHEAALNLVPPKELLVVRTEDISDRAHEIARFCGFDESCLRQDSTHVFRTPTPKDVLGDLDSQALERDVEILCGPVMDRLRLR